MVAASVAVLLAYEHGDSISTAACVFRSAALSATNAMPMALATFTMLSGGGVPVVVDTTVTVHTGSGTCSVASTTLSLGQNWTAHSGTTFGPGTYSIPTKQGGTYTGIIVDLGQVGDHIQFNWGVTTDIDIAYIWDVVGDTYTSTDVTAGNSVGFGAVRGLAMIDFIERKIQLVIMPVGQT